jgi:hypothetical protein
MRSLAILFVLLVLAIPISASHIVGGEFELLYLSGPSYRLNLIWYFDVVNNPGRLPESQEPNIVVTIYRKSDNKVMRTVTLLYVGNSKERVGYTQPECSSGEIVTDKLLYSAFLDLPDTEYSDPGGYYVSWQRCCRNYTIGNIISEDPAQNGVGAGQTFYLEFPPVTKNGKPFINSSPRLFPPLNDYACPGKPYYVDFAGIDDDGDSVVYSLAPPLNTSSAAALPPASPRPYNPVDWRPGHGLDRIVNGTPVVPSFPDLRISTDGFINVTPRSQGLFAFAIKVEEFRDKEKIGESRRDFQMLVTDCPQAAPPKITGKKTISGSFQSDLLTVSFDATTPDADRCLLVSVADPDANKPESNFIEFVRIKVIPLNFKSKKPLDLIQGESSGFIRNEETKEFTVCLSACPYFEGGPYLIGIVAYDDACALPLTDTLRVSVDVEAPLNERAAFKHPDKITAQLNEGEAMTWPFEAHDADGDNLIFSLKTDGFLLDKAGMKASTQTTPGSGVLTGTFDWDAFCDIYDFTQRTSYEVQLMVDDDDVCGINLADTLTFKLNVVLPGNDPPFIDTDLTSSLNEMVVDAGARRVTEKVEFHVSGWDLIDNDNVTIRMAGEGFKPGDYGMIFNKATAKGSVSSLFSWDLACNRFTPLLKDMFTLKFMAIDSTNKCRVRKIDSVIVNVQVVPPLNHKPVFTITNLNPALTLSDSSLNLSPGQQINLQLTVTDLDATPQDKLHIRLADAGGEGEPSGYIFTPVEGVGTQVTSLLWNPDCAIFTEESFDKNYYFDFRYGDDHCLSSTSDTVRVRVNLSDIVSEGFTQDPPNVFTPNGDDFNEYFAMERIDENGEVISVLPPDNCRGHFEGIRIYNRWGTTVFSSTERTFRWYGNDAPAGVYFYLIKFNDKEFKGSVSLRN